MTNKEAMQRLFAILHDDRFSWTQESVDAFYVALEKLKNSTEELKNSNDCISRQAAIDAFLTELTKRERKNLLHTWSTVEVKYFVVDMLEKLPSAQPEPIWGLPVSADRPLADREIIPRLRQIQAGIPGRDYAIDRAIEVIEAVCRMEDDGK